MPSLFEVEAIEELGGLDKALTELAKDRDGSIKMVAEYDGMDSKGKRKKVGERPYGNAITTGLSDFQVDKLKQAVKDIRSVDGCYKLFAAQKLYELRGILRGNKNEGTPRQWTAFKNSGLVPFSAREIQDLCGSYEWLRDSGLEGEMLNTVGIRTMAMIANCDNETIQSELKGMLMTGEQVTRKVVDEKLKALQPKPVAKTEDDQITEKKKEITKYKTEVLRDKYIQLFTKTLALQKEISERKKAQEELRNQLKINK